MNTPGVTVGIPAFNEENNIQAILKDILNQKRQGYRLENIIVASDGSTDATVKKVKAINSPIITVLDNPDRKGVAVRQNQLMNKSNSDVLVLLNADLSIKDPKFIYKITRPFLDKTVDLASVNILPVAPKYFFGKMLYVSTEYKNLVFNNFHSGDNWYTCHGAARAFSKRLYKNIIFKRSVGEDLYSYLYTKYHSYNYAFVKEATVKYRLPENLHDHEKQSFRFRNSTPYIEEEFGTKFINANIIWPKSRLFIFGFLTFVIHPFLASVYMITNSYLAIKYRLIKTITIDKWEISRSTKYLH